MTKAEAQTRAFIDDVTLWAWMVGITIITAAFLWGTGFFSWEYDAEQPTKGAVVQTEVNPDGYFQQQKCAFLWFDCHQLYSNYRIGVVDDYKTGVIVVTPEEFEKYKVGSYYP